MPDYLTLYSGDTRLRSTHLDNLSFVSNIASTTASIKNLNKSFFIRTHTLWNSLPFDIRNSMRISLSISGAYKHCLTTSMQSTNGHYSHQMKVAKFITQSNYALERVLQILVWGSGGHLVS